MSSIHDSAKKYSHKKTSSLIRYCYIYSPSWELEWRRRAKDLLDEEVDRANEQLENRGENSKTRIQIIGEKVDLLESNISQLCTFHKESERKREKTAEKIVKTGLKLTANKNLVKQLKLQVSYLKRLRQDLVGRLEKFTIFKDFLNEVCVESNGKFESLEHFLERFNFILEMRSRYLNLNKKLIEEIEQEWRNYTSTKQALEKKFLDDQIKLCELRKHQSQLELELNVAHKQLDDLKSLITNNIREPDQMMSAIHNLRLEICERLEFCVEKANEHMHIIAPLVQAPNECKSCLEADDINSSGTLQQTRFIRDGLKQIDEIRKNARVVLSPDSLKAEVDGIQSNENQKIQLQSFTPDSGDI